MSENTEARDIIDTAQEAVEPHQLTDGIWVTRDSNGGVVRINLTEDIERAQPNPNRKIGDNTVVDVTSFAAYLTKHGIDATELWGSRDRGTIRAVINAHDGDPASDGPVGDFADDGQPGDPGWGDHTVTLQLRHSDDWNDWTTKNGQWLNQVDFAEFVEDHLPNFGSPTGAEALELAQSFRATQKVEFGTTKHAGGATTLSYVESTDAKAGKKGDLVFPDKVTLGIHVYDQGKAYALDARLRYRVRAGELLMGYKLDRPRDVLQTAFDDVVTDVQQATGRDVWATT